MLIEELCDEVSKYEFPVVLYIKDYFSLYVLQFFIAQCTNAFDLVPFSLCCELKLRKVTGFFRSHPHYYPTQVRRQKVGTSLQNLQKWVHASCALHGVSLKMRRQLGYHLNNLPLSWIPLERLLV
jgi:hypothetical protein